MNAFTRGNPALIADPVYREVCAAALRAAADEVIPEMGDPVYGLTQRENEQQVIRSKLLTIATELEDITAGSTDAIGTVGNRPLRNGPAAERIARMQRARAILASNPPKEMTRQEINEEISACRKLKRLATAS